MNVTAETVELANRDGRLAVSTGQRQRGGKLGAAVEGVRPLAAFMLFEFCDDFEASAPGEAG